MNHRLLSSLLQSVKPAFLFLSKNIRSQKLGRLLTNTMSTSSASCRLVCLQHSHEDIPLPDGVTVNIGRSPATKIIDPRCSRNQVALTSYWSAKKVKVLQLGGNPSSVDGSVIGPKNEVEAGEASTLFILDGQYPHKVVFTGIDHSKSKNRQKSVDDVKDEKKTKEINQSHSSAKVDKEKEELKKAHKRRSSCENGLKDAKKKKLDDTLLDSAKSSDKKKEKVDRMQNKIKNEKEDDPSEEAHLNLMASKLKEMNRSIAKDKNGKNVTRENKSSLSSSSSSSSPKISTSKSSSKSSSSSSPPPPPSKDNVWAQHEHLHVFTSKGVESRKKIAGFDVDGTIILTKSGKTFPENVHDWKIAFPEIFGKLKQLHKTGFKIVFFTNQLGVARGKVKIEDLKLKLENIVSKLQVPVQIFVATHEGRFRKPVDGMWRKLKKQYNGGVEVDPSLSLFVGDAAGRPAIPEHKKKKDFSCSDRLFALNIGVDFQTPEEFFLQHKKADFTMPVFDPRKLSSTDAVISPGCKLTLDEKELIVLVGLPASGKSHFVKHSLKPKGYVVVNRDTLGTWQKCVKVTKESLVNSSVVVDNTNITVEERKRYLDCAHTAGVPCRCFIMTTTVEHCRHNEKFRQMTDSTHAKINDMIFNSAKAKFKEPQAVEGFSEIVKVNFIPKFSSSSLAADYKKFIIEK